MDWAMGSSCNPLGSLRVENVSGGQPGDVRSGISVRKKTHVNIALDLSRENMGNWWASQDRTGFAAESGHYTRQQG